MLGLAGDAVHESRFGIRNDKVLIDCTGDANVVALAGGELVYPEIFQPATLAVLASGYDPDRLDLDAINRAYEEYVAEGLLEYTDSGWKVAQANAGPGLYPAARCQPHPRSARP